MIEEQDEQGHTHYWYTASEVVKMLALKDTDDKLIGRNKFLRALRYNKVIMANNEPYQYYIMLGHMKLHSTTKRWKSYYVPVFSERGVNYLRNKFEDYEFIVYTKRDEEQNLNLIGNIDDIL